MSSEKIQQLSDRILKLVDQAVTSLELEGGLDDRSVRTLETINKIVTVLSEREKGRKIADPMDSMSDEELLEALKD
jgi:hypothetical protein